ncbi:MAG: hypothetical protein IKS48_05810 [Eubacterium sp.]|nr:hypothetical protein [Eubacterium sp.]
MYKKRIALVLSFIIIMGTSITALAGSATGKINAAITGSVSVDFSSNYGCYAGTITDKPSGIVKLVGYKNSFTTDVKSQTYTGTKKTIGFKKSVGKKCKKVLVAIAVNGTRKVSATQTR